jgi:hypothetical protein
LQILLEFTRDICCFSPFFQRTSQTFSLSAFLLRLGMQRYNLFSLLFTFSPTFPSFFLLLPLYQYEKFFPLAHFIPLFAPFCHFLPLFTLFLPLFRPPETHLLEGFSLLFHFFYSFPEVV